MIVSGIYKIVNKINSKYYVGSSSNIKFRFAQHKTELRKGTHWNDYLQNAWDKYGEENFKFIIIQKTQNLKEVEQQYLDEAEKDKLSYNLNFNATHTRFGIKTRQKMSLAKIGKCIGEKNPAFKAVPKRAESELEQIWIKHGKNTLFQIGQTKFNLGGCVCNRLIRKFKENIKAKKEREENRKLKSKSLFKNNNISVKTGYDNTNFNPLVFTFINPQLNKEFYGTCFDFIQTYGIKKIYSVASGTRKSTHGWRIKF